VLKLGTCLYNFIWQSPLPDAIRRAASLGFGAIEIMATPPQLDARAFDGAQRDAVLEVLEETGVKVVAVNPTSLDMNLASRNDTFRRESVNEVKACIDVAASLGAEIVLVAAGRRHPLVLDPVEISNARAYPAIRECVEYAASKGVIYGFENVPSLYFERCDEIAAFIDEMDNPYCRAVFDSGNARWTQQDIGEAVRAMGDRLCHVHLCDGDGSRFVHWPVGKGDIAFGEIAKALTELDYQGWSFLETTWMEDPDWALTSSVATLTRNGWELVPPTRPATDET
jgi:sugar phosphate isomerase/epimerase